MIGFYLLLVFGFVVFLFINIYAFSLGLLTSIYTIIIFELIFLWVCIGPQIVLYYILKLKKSINSYNNLYQVYKDALKEVDELNLENIKTKKEFNLELENLKDIPNSIIERQKLTIQELTKQRDRYKDEYIYLKRKYLEETNRKDGK